MSNSSINMNMGMMTVIMDGDSTQAVKLFNDAFAKINANIVCESIEFDSISTSITINLGTKYE